MKRRLNQTRSSRRRGPSQFLKRTTAYFVRQYLSPFPGDSNARLVVLCRIIFLVSVWLFRLFPTAASRPFGKTYYFVRPRYSTTPVSPPCTPRLDLSFFEIVLSLGHCRAPPSKLISENLARPAPRTPQTQCWKVLGTIFGPSPNIVSGGRGGAFLEIKF